MEINGSDATQLATAPEARALTVPCPCNHQTTTRSLAPKCEESTSYRPRAHVARVGAARAPLARRRTRDKYRETLLEFDRLLAVSPPAGRSHFAWAMPDFKMANGRRVGIDVSCRSTLRTEQWTQNKPLPFTPLSRHNRSVDPGSSPVPVPESRDEQYPSPEKYTVVVHARADIRM